MVSLFEFSLCSPSFSYGVFRRKQNAYLQLQAYLFSMSARHLKVWEKLQSVLGRPTTSQQDLNSRWIEDARLLLGCSHSQYLKISFRGNVSWTRERLQTWRIKNEMKFWWKWMGINYREVVLMSRIIIVLHCIFSRMLGFGSWKDVFFFTS